MGMGKMGMGGGKMGGGGMGGFRGPSAKAQLASLVTKLSLLSGKPLALSLSDDQKKKVAEQVQKIEEPAELADEEAKKRLDALLDVLKDQRVMLEAVGYRWPSEGGGGFRPPADSPNPFKDEKNAASLKSLREQLSTAKPK